MSIDLHLSFDLPAPPSRVMELLTDSVLIRKWSGGEAILDTQVGGLFAMFDNWVTGTMIAIAPNELSYTWKTTDWEADTAPSVVHYTLKAGGKGTLVELSHTNLPNQDEADSHKAGWSDYIFDPLEDYIMIFDKPE
jgi:uncharacterized protein YndB with AHSA1/START domain